MFPKTTNLRGPVLSFPGLSTEAAEGPAAKAVHSQWIRGGEAHGQRPAVVKPMAASALLGSTPIRSRGRQTHSLQRQLHQNQLERQRITSPVRVVAPVQVAQVRTVAGHSTASGFKANGSASLTALRGCRAMTTWANLSHIPSSEWAMAMTIHVSLLSGTSASLRVFPYWRLSDLKRAAGRVLRVKVGELSTQQGALLQGDGTSLGEVGLEDGDMLTATARKPQRIYSNWSSGVFALVRSDGQLITWGSAAYGGRVGPERRPWNVALVVLGGRALAALLTDGRVQCFGDAAWGGDAWWRGEGGGGDGGDGMVDCSQVQRDLVEVKDVKAAGQPGHGGRCNMELKEVVEVVSNNMAFAAITRHRSVVTWGNAECGGVISDGLKDPGEEMLPAGLLLRCCETKLWWLGVIPSGAESGPELEQAETKTTYGLVSVISSLSVIELVTSFCLAATRAAPGGRPRFRGAAARRHGRPLGRCHLAAAAPAGCGDSSAVQLQLRASPLRDLVASSGAFAALLCDGQVITWGDPDAGGDSSHVQAGQRLAPTGDGDMTK
eukprot:Skav230955  [mRNA]  locus=scaffold3010:229334:241165:- [translate_table: standard]